MLQENVAEGVHRIEDAYTNWYLVEDGAALTIVDACVPTSWKSFEEALTRLGKARSDVKALVLTHAISTTSGSQSARGRSSASPSTCTRTTCG